MDFRSGERRKGPLLLRVTRWPLRRLSLYVRAGAQIEFAEPVPNTRLFANARQVVLRFDESYLGFEASSLSAWVRFDGGT